MENFKLFEEWVSNTDKLETIFKGLDKPMIVEIALEKGKDDPQLIFESMNSKGIELGANGFDQKLYRNGNRD